MLYPSGLKYSQSEQNLTDAGLQSVHLRVNNIFRPAFESPFVGKDLRVGNWLDFASVSRYRIGQMLEIAHKRRGTVLHFCVRRRVAAAPGRSRLDTALCQMLISQNIYENNQAGEENKHQTQATEVG